MVVVMMRAFVVVQFNFSDRGVSQSDPACLFIEYDVEAELGSV